ncbi:hypothetical protein [Diaphorobacter caeni]|uniref:hypothetical protein n=1 Tax=Diaphorobacter caeni TaxID=2784387 RepID=UPI00188E497C|nr:hypothetical protein [Diaphorobacter caeni]MBF5007809.1 hypothetical protein [Diaphorobacter caeni]
MAFDTGPMSIVDVLTGASSKARIQSKISGDSRFPVVVSGETRVYLDAQCDALGVSLAGLCGTILDEVVAESMRRALLIKNPKQS